MEVSENRVYIADTNELNEEMVFRKLYDTVSRERQEKIDKLRFVKDKRLSLGAGLLLNKVLEEFGIQEYTLCYGENGKPYLKEYPDIRFNLSHSEERVLCVISNMECGCDVEIMKETDYKVADHFFAEQEKNILKKEQIPEEKRNLFYRLWTLKESFLKVTGLGMKLSMKDFSFQIEKEKVSVCQKVSKEQYYFKEYDLKDGYKYAVCSLNPHFGQMEKVKFVI